jgi:hypothetical protein
LRLFCLAALLTVCCGLVSGFETARASDVSDFPDFPDFFQPQEGEVLTVVIENDMFGGTDRHYTNGLRLEWVSAEEAVSPWLLQAARTQPFVKLKGASLREGYALAHTLYTASDITLDDPPSDDHPYAAHLSVNWFASARTANSEHTILVDVGLIGPSAQGEFVQSRWHQLIDGKEPRGWDGQLHDELVFAISGQRTERLHQWEFGAYRADLMGHSGLTLGTLRTDLSVGATVRFGTDLQDSFAPPRMRPALSPSSIFTPNQPVSAYVFASLGGYAVGRDVFLDGNTFRDSASVERNIWVGDVQAGAALHINHYRLAFTYVVRSEQYDGQNGPQRFGAIALSRAF